MALINRTPHDFSENVVSPFIARKNSISDCERRGTRMVRNDAHRETLLSLRFVVSISELGSEIDYGSNQVSVVVRLDVLQNYSETLKSGASINGWLRQISLNDFTPCH
jgi:hypothetical protein